MEQLYPDCGLVLDRDHNATLNIEKTVLVQTGIILAKLFYTPVTCRFIYYLKNACGDDVRPLLPMVFTTLSIGPKSTFNFPI